MEEFKELFPGAKTVPQILYWITLYDDMGEYKDEIPVVIEGYERLKEHLNGSSPLPTNS